MSRVVAGDFTTLVVVAGSFLRPVGGWLSDRVGGYRLLVGLLAAAGLCLGVVASLPPAGVAVAVLGVGMGLLGMGNGAVFQLVPQRFPERIGLVTGVVGAAGGLGGFFLPTLLGSVKDLTGQYTLGLVGRGGALRPRHRGAAGAGRLLVRAVGADDRGADRRLLISCGAALLRRTNRRHDT